MNGIIVNVSLPFFYSSSLASDDEMSLQIFPNTLSDEESEKDFVIATRLTGVAYPSSQIANHLCKNCREI